MIVIDASAALEILSRSETGLKLEAAVLDLDLHAPHLIDLEVLNVVRRWERSGEVGRREATHIIGIFRGIRITRHSHETLLNGIWAVRQNLTAYGASYLALAKALNAELITMDSALRKMAARPRGKK